MAEMSRDAEIRKIWHDNHLFYKLLGAAVLIGVGMLLGRIIYATPDADQAWGYGVNIYTSVISTAVTVLILDELNRRRSKREAKAEAEAEYQQQLIDDAASSSNEVAKNAVHQIRRKDWLYGENGLLKGADLGKANLQNVDLSSANLRSTHLSEANLQEANLRGAQLQRSALVATNFRDANLAEVNLRGAWLLDADLQNANLTLSWLEGASFNRADLQGAILAGADFSEVTRLPDGTYWTPGTDMSRFTDPKHPDFWRSDNQFSPAYRGKSEG